MMSGAMPLAPSAAPTASASIGGAPGPAARPPPAPGPPTRPFQTPLRSGCPSGVRGVATAAPSWALPGAGARCARMAAGPSDSATATTIRWYLGNLIQIPPRPPGLQLLASSLYRALGSLVRKTNTRPSGNCNFCTKPVVDPSLAGKPSIVTMSPGFNPPRSVLLIPD